jgi:hypothetical protein
MSNEALMHHLLDAMPALVFLVDKDVSILDCNAAAQAFCGSGMEHILRKRGGEVLQCSHSEDVAEGCGRGQFCSACPIRTAVNEAFKGKRCVRRLADMERLSNAHTRKLRMLVTASAFVYQGHDRAVLILEDVDELLKIAKSKGPAKGRVRHNGHL